MILETAALLRATSNSVGEEIDGVLSRTCAGAARTSACGGPCHARRARGARAGEHHAARFLRATAPRPA